MTINGTKILTAAAVPVNAVKNSRRDAEKSTVSSITADSQSTTPATGLQLSSLQHQLRATNSQDINADRVATLKKAISEGTLQIDTGKIADGLLAAMQQH